MKEEILYNSLLEEIAQKIPRKTEIVNTLAGMLCLGKEAVYRRLRREVPFTFNEVITISRQLGISLDNLETDSSPKTQPFKLKLIEYINPAASDFALMEEMTTIMKSFKDGSDACAGEIANILPQPLYVNYRNIFRFYLFKWKYQTYKEKVAIPYKDIVVLDKLQKAQEEYGIWARKLHADYVFDPQLFQHFITNVQYFCNIGLITRSEIALLREDLLRLLDEIELLSRTGVFPETGKKVNIYISAVNIDTNYIYVSAPDYQLTIIKAFLLNGVASTDRATFEEVRCWMRSIQQQSVLITGSGERERIAFLDEQHNTVNKLSLL